MTHFLPFSVCLSLSLTSGQVIKNGAASLLRASVALNIGLGPDLSLDYGQKIHEAYYILKFMYAQLSDIGAWYKIGPGLLAYVVLDTRA